jgi:hypothetical protein
MSRQQKEISLKDNQTGETKDFKIGEVPPIEAQSYKLLELARRYYRVHRMDVFDTREVCMTYPINLVPKVGEYKNNENMFRLLMKYVEVKVGDQWVRLDNDEVIRQNVPPMVSFELEKEVVDLTTGFFSSGKLQDYTSDILAYLMQNVIITLMKSLEQSSLQGEQA